MIFHENDSNGDGFLAGPEMDQVLADLGINRSFGRVLHRVLAKHDRGVSFEDVLDFFSILVSGNIRRFYRSLFEAMDFDGDGNLGTEDIISFSTLMNEEIGVSEAEQILKECGVGPRTPWISKGSGNGIRMSMDCKNWKKKRKAPIGTLRVFE
jgi:Ca2+-binding EF-hand superfamily protein